MSRRRAASVLVTLVLLLAVATAAGAQSRGVKAITAADMKPHVAFLGSKEFRGRSAPSPELDIAAKYLAVEAAKIGLQPLMPGGSYFQHLPVEVTTLSPVRSFVRVTGPGGEMTLRFPQSFTSSVRAPSEWSGAGGLVFAGSALSWSQGDLWGAGLGDVRGKFVVMLDVPLRQVGQRTPASSSSRIQFLREKGAAGIVTVISPEREKALSERGLSFDLAERLRFLDVDTVNPAPPGPAVSLAIPQPATVNAVEVRHAAAAALLGISREELTRLFDVAVKGQDVAPRAVGDVRLDVAVAFDRQMKTTPNVVAWLPGNDPKLKDEYVVIGSHHDHNPPREGRIFPGADDNVSGCVGMLAIAKAMLVERPKRSVIFVWHTAEERGLVGAYYFVQHSPVPVEKITANLNLDMISRNDPNGIYLIGSNKLSSELDKSFHEMNRELKLTLDYKYEDPGEPNRFFFRSDQYPYIRYGIPGVWVFCGTTPDYHTEGDAEEKVDYGKMEKVTRLTYLVAMDVGNKPALLKLDLHPEVKARGAHNMNVVWQRPRM